MFSKCPSFLHFFASSFLRFFVSSVLHSKVSKFRSSKVSVFQRCKVAKMTFMLFPIDLDPILPNVQFVFFLWLLMPCYQIPFRLFDRHWSHIQELQTIINRIFRICPAPPFPEFSKISISCFLEHIDTISKAFKKLLDASSGSFGPRPFPKRLKLSMFKMLRFPINNILRKRIGIVLELDGVSWCLQR